ncbi:hypothetical protein GCM10023340_00330 [Nocardioides marinquilinus]|uniref:Malectin domain-containing protein n=2 Tax=Nocardioides marinquilinus TaxID=1210400 RepID=A0ABP9P3U3_9ACTN
MVFGAAGQAQAVTRATGDPDTNRSTHDGAGDADASSRATAQGRLTVHTDADGGNAQTSPGIPGLPGLPGGSDAADNQTRASADASVRSRYQVADGTYRVVVRYRGAHGVERDRNSSRADLDLHTTVQFKSNSGGRNLSFNQRRDLPGNPRAVTSSFTIKVPDDSSGFFTVDAALEGISTANGRGGEASTRGEVAGVSVSVNRI